MVPVHWLIDVLRRIQAEGPVALIGFVVTIVSLLLLVIAGVQRVFRRGYQDIEDENHQLKARAQATRETLNNVRQKNAGLHKEIDSLQARLPETVLGVVEREIRDGNHGIAIKKLQVMFDDLSPGLAACCSRLSELASDPSAQGDRSNDAANAGRFGRLSGLLRAAQAEAPP